MDGVATGIAGGGPDLEGLETWWSNPRIAAWSFVLFGCFLLNATLLLAFLIRPGLRTISNRFVMNLSVSNLLTCTLLNPLLMTDSPVYAAGNLMRTSTLTPDDATSSSFDDSTWSTGNICTISEGATALVTTSSVLSVLLIAVDQYFAVVDPLRYRARVDKLKSGVLIGSVWLVSAIFGLIAALNPNPRSLWLSCTTATLLGRNSSFREYVALNVSSGVEAPAVESAFTFFGNETQIAQEEIEDATSTLLEIDSIRIGRKLDLFDNSTVTFSSLSNNDSVTYGLIYVIVHSVFAYLLPFAGICWIYISIYSAAHRNSERTRRTGSRPILASASFCEDPYGVTRPQPMADAFPEEFRRIPKISSLSSIDETSETAHSTNQMSRRRSFSSSLDAAQSRPGDENTLLSSSSSAVVFTVGLQPVKLSASRGNDSDNDLTEAAALKADYLENVHDARNELEEADANHRRSSCDSTNKDGETSGWIAGDSSDSESEDERPYDYFDTLKVPRSICSTVADRKSFSESYFLSLGEEAAREEEQSCSHRDAIDPRRGSSSKEIDRDRISEDENSIVIKMTEQIRDEIPNSNGNLENKRSRRSSRRSSRSGILEIGNGDPQAIVRSSESNNLESSSCLLTPIVTITPAPGKSPGTLHRVSSVRSTGSYINSLKYRISNGSLFRYREETRAARISALVIVMGLICWSPYVLLSVVKNLPQYSDHEFPHKYDVLALSFLILAAYSSPLLFGYRSKRVKRELRKFFCFHRELSYKNNRSLMAKKVLKRRHSSTLSQLDMDHRYNIFNCVYGRNRWPKEKVQFVQVPDTALAVETCRSSFSSGASTQISSTSTEEC